MVVVSDDISAAVGVCRELVVVSFGVEENGPVLYEFLVQILYYH